jgi:hypothetical protein
MPSVAIKKDGTKISKIVSFLDPRAIVRLEGLGQLKKSNDLIRT